MSKIILAAGPLDPAISYEYQNFLKPLEKLGHAVVPFDFVASIQSRGREAMNQALLECARRERPDLVLVVPHTDQFLPEVIDAIGRQTVTLGYFFDDMWRVEYSRFWARHFSFVTTSDVHGVHKFRDAGLVNVLYSPFACNADVYCRLDVPKQYDVTFVGQYHPRREWMIRYLRRAGLPVQVWGMGWPGGMIQTEEVVRIFNQSRINLNLSNCVSWDVRYLLSPHRSAQNSLRVWRQLVRALTRPDNKVVEQVKGRHFEINACGGFQLSYYVEGLERLYAIGDEIALYETREDLAEKIRFYLQHPALREAMAERGYRRTLNQHTMELRLAALLSDMKIAP